MARRTLAEMNERIASLGLDFENWHGLGWTVRTERAIGSAGTRGAGTHCHVVTVQVVAALQEHARKGKVGQLAGVVPLCNGNGQFNGRVHPGLDTDRVTCAKCLAKIGS